MAVSQSERETKLREPAAIIPFNHCAQMFLVPLGGSAGSSQPFSGGLVLDIQPHDRYVSYSPKSEF